MNPGRRAAGWLLAWCAFGSGAAQAEWWTLDRSVESRLESNDNYLLSPQPGSVVNSLSMGLGASATRQSENASTRLDGGLTRYMLRGVTGLDHLEGHVGVDQSLADLTDSAEFGLNYQQDTTFNTVVNSSDLSLGRGQRRTRNALVNWSHQFDERWSNRLTLTDTRVGYAQDLVGASSYRSTSVASNALWRLDDIDALNAEIGHSDYRAEDGSNRSITDDFSLGGSRSMSESTNASLSVGRYRTRSVGQRIATACPLQPAYCQAGVIPYAVVQVPSRSTLWGLQYSAGGKAQWNEVTELVFGAARQQSPSGVGVVSRTDSLSFGLNQAWSETLNFSAGISRSQSSYPGLAGGPVQVFQTVNLSWIKTVTPDWSVQTAYRYNRFEERHAGVAAHSNNLALVLKYQWPRTDASW